MKPSTKATVTARRTAHERPIHLRLLPFVVKTSLTEAFRRTRYAMLNAVAEWADHFKGIRLTGNKQENAARLESSWFGSSAVFKQEATELLVTV